MPSRGWRRTVGALSVREAATARGDYPRTVVPTVVGTVAEEVVHRLTAMLEGCATSDGIVQRLTRHGWVLIDVIEMDEYTLDWVLGAEGVWLVFDTT